MNKTKILEVIIVSAIVVAGFCVRLYKIDNPVLDWHAWRQADTAAVARSFYKEGFNPFIPKYDDMTGWAEKISDNVGPPPNPGRYRFVEFPIYNTLVYAAYLINGGVNEALARLVSVAMSVGSMIMLYLLTKRYFGKATALLTIFIFAFLPYNIYFSRVILPEPTLVFFSLGMLYFADKWIFENKRWQLPVAILFTACALLVKPVAAFYFLPLFYSIYQKEKMLVPKQKRYIMYFILSVLPLIVWRLWMLRYPAGIPASNWLLNGNGIRYKPAFWWWIFSDRLGREILTVFGTILFFVGILFRPENKKYFMHFLALGAFLFLITFATGNVQHDYYQTFIVPILCIFTARGVYLLAKGLPDLLPKIVTIPAAAFFVLLTFYFGWKEIKGFYNINNPEFLVAGKAADQLLPKDAIVIAPNNGDTSFLYQTNRIGWPEVAFPTQEMVDRFNVGYYISVNNDAKTEWLSQKYTVIAKMPNYVIIDLTKKSVNYNKDIGGEPNQQ